ncbi:MAG TPA: hypothetical protein VH914_09395 [Acidimicrobiia bacterium]|jgi:hypothetical protein|nr:hypothetical protein [Acidimicrobiia bacterium]
MALWFALGVLGVIVLFLLLAIATEPGPQPADVARAYEMAWDRLDFDTLFDLSGPELRDGAKREGFIATKRAAYASAKRERLGARIEVEDVTESSGAALVVTNVATDQGSVHNNVLMERRSGRWYVVAYSLRTG